MTKPNRSKLFTGKPLMKKIFTTIISLMILAFHAEAQSPIVTSINPNSVINNDTQPITSIDGTNFGTETGLVGLWHFNGDATDSSGNHNDGAGAGITYGPSYGKFGQGVSFNGSGYINLGSGSNLNITSNLSIAFWIKTSSTGAQYVYDHGANRGAGTGYGIGVALAFAANGQIAFMSGNIWNHENGTINDGTWHHVAVTLSGTTVTFYKDGAVDGVGTGATPISNGAIGVIGAEQLLTLQFTGYLDELRIYNCALSATEIQQLYNQNNLMQVQLTKNGQPTINCNGFTLTNSTTLSNGSCPVKGAATGQWNVVVTNPNGMSGTLTNGLTITHPNSVFFGTDF